MMPLSNDARFIAESVMRQGAMLSEQLGGTINGQWDSSYLWNQRVLTMRLEAGALKGALSHLEMGLAPDLAAALPEGMMTRVRDEIAAAEAVLDRVQTDQTGFYREALVGFEAFGSEIAAEMRRLLEQADAAGAGAADAVEGVATGGPWTLAPDAPATWTLAADVPTATWTLADDVPTEAGPSTDVRRAVEHLATREAGA